ncbi:hypothetical protein [Promicromonospora iranensis]|nr:hypothetical protein [Promicromonospora iranensis]
MVRDALAASEEVGLRARTWQEGGRGDLTARDFEERLDACVVALIDTLA